MNGTGRIVLSLSLVAVMLFCVTPAFAGPFSIKVNGKEVDLGELFGGKKKEEKKNKPKRSRPQQSAQPARPDTTKDDFLFDPEEEETSVDSAAPAVAAGGGEEPPLATANVSSATPEASATAPSGSDTTVKAPGSGTHNSQAELSIRGLRIGMTPAEVRTVIKKMGAKPWKRTTRVRGGREYDFRADKESVDSMGGTVFMEWINGTNYEKSFDTNFTPSFPGEERAMQIEMSVNYPRKKQISVGRFEAALIKKYGRPTYIDKGRARRYWWVFDIDGKVMSGFKADSSTLNLCGRTLNIALQRSETSSMAKKIYDLRTRCGSQTLFIRTRTRSSLVTEYTAILHGNEEYILSSVATKAKIKAIIESRRSGAASGNEIL